MNHEKRPPASFLPSYEEPTLNRPIVRFLGWKNLDSRPMTNFPFRGYVGRSDGLEKFRPRAFPFSIFIARTRKSGPTDARFAPFPFSLFSSPLFSTSYSYLFFFFFFLFLVNREYVEEIFKGMGNLTSWTTKVIYRRRFKF